jgi:putative endonuclease
MYFRHELGRESESQARDWFLEQRGYRLLECNYRCRWGEIDLIFEQELDGKGKTELVFVEVRARGETAWVSPMESLDWKKQRRLQKTAQYYLSSYRGLASSMRFDLVFRQGSSWGHLPNLWLIPS